MELPQMERVEAAEDKNEMTKAPPANPETGSGFKSEGLKTGTVFERIASIDRRARTRETECAS
jgi:hypothetical protein